MLAKKVSPSGLALDPLKIPQRKRRKLASPSSPTQGYIVRERLNLTEAFGQDSTAVLGVDNPVVVLERVHDLQDRAHPPNGVVDVHCAYELRCQVRVQRQLHLYITPPQVSGFYKGNGI